MKMNSCIVPIWLAYFMMIYLIASIYYLIQTYSMDTPFKDSLNQTQKQILLEQKQIRRNIFYQGVGFGIISLVLFQPFPMK